MAGDVTYALEVLKLAMQMEKEGREFYLKAAQTTQDQEGRDTFRMLADDEKNHFNLIERQYNTLREDKKWIGLPEIKKVRIDLDEPLFPKGKEAVEKAVAAKSDDLDALLFGLDIEIQEL